MKVLLVNGVTYVKKWGKLYLVVITNDAAVMIRIKEIKQ